MASFDNVLYIIGNGFDLHHGVMSSYKSFAMWLQWFRKWVQAVSWYDAYDKKKDSDKEKSDLERIMRNSVINKDASLEMITLQGIQRGV